MKTAIGLCIAFALAVPGAQAQKVPPVVAEQDRHVPGGRAVQLTLRQTQIETSVDIGRVADYNYDYRHAYPIWGSLFGDVDGDMHGMLRKAQRDKAEALAPPLRKALAGFDVDAVALAATSAALAKPDWFQPESITVAKDPSGEVRASFLASGSASQLALIWYRYELSPDFSQIRVIAEVTLMRKRRAGDAGSDPLTPIYRQRILSAVQLRARSYEPKENVASWCADDGKRAKAALTAAFGQLGHLLPYALDLRQADIRGFEAKNREKAYAAGFYGALIARNATEPDDLLIWSGGIVHAQSIP